MNKVYVTNRSSHDFSAAEHFGELIYLTDGEVSKFNTSKMHRLLYPILKEAGDADYLLPTSMSILSIVATGILVSRFGKVRILLFDAARNRYVSRTIRFSGVPNDEETRLGEEEELG